MNLIGKNITYKPDNQFHLNDVSFDFKKGNLYTILGRTLSGKTTFLKTIAGLLNPDTGELFFEDKDFSKIPVWERNVAMVYQQFINYPHLNVFENIAFPLKQRKIDQSIINEKVMDALKSVGLLGYENRKIQELSGGQQQRVSLARSLVKNAKILLLDEPYAALDILSIKMIQEIIINLQSMERMSIIVCDHNARDLLTCVDRAIVLSNGKIIASGSPQEIINDTHARSVYFGNEFKIN